MKNIGIITRPISKAGYVPLSNLSKILSSIGDNLYIITGNEGLELPNKNEINIIKISQKDSSWVFTKVIRHILLQIEISINMLFLINKVNKWVFFLDSHSFLLPVLTARLISNDVILVIVASIIKSSNTKRDYLTKFLIFSEKISFYLSNKIIIYSKNLIVEWELKKHINKIFIASEHLIDFNIFSNEKKISERDNLVGYIGRLSEEKGILNFIEAAYLLKNSSDLKFVICGDGHLRKKVEEKLNITDKKIQFVGWISHEDLPEYLNQLKLLVIPSFTEGLPNIMIEAMACNTPILTTPVGAIPDLVKDEENGFIMGDNSPKCIANNILRSLNHPDIEKISRNGTKTVKEEFRYSAVVEKWKKIID